MPQHWMNCSQVLALYFVCASTDHPSFWESPIELLLSSIALTGLLLLLCHDNFNIMLKLKQYSLHWIAKITLSSKIIFKLWLLSKLPRIVSNPLSILCGIRWTSLGGTLGGILCEILRGIPWIDLGSVRFVMGPMWLVTHMWGSLLVDALVVGSVVGFVAWLSGWHVHQHYPHGTLSYSCQAASCSPSHASKILLVHVCPPQPPQSSHRTCQVCIILCWGGVLQKSSCHLLFSWERILPKI